MYLVFLCTCTDELSRVSHRYMGIGLSAQGVNMNRLPGKLTRVRLLPLSVVFVFATFCALACLWVSSCEPVGLTMALGKLAWAVTEFVYGGCRLLNWMYMQKLVVLWWSWRGRGRESRILLYFSWGVFPVGGKKDHKRTKSHKNVLHWWNNSDGFVCIFSQTCFLIHHVGQQLIQ